jgi:hypothetical protein
MLASPSAIDSHLLGIIRPVISRVGAPLENP